MAEKTNVGVAGNTYVCGFGSYPIQGIDDTRNMAVYCLAT